MTLWPGDSPCILTAPRTGSIITSWVGFWEQAAGRGWKQDSSGIVQR